MTAEIKKKVEEARRAAEDEIGFTVTDEFAEEILELCKRKCVCAGKNEDYLPIMYRFELPMKVKAYALNRVSEAMQKIRKEVDQYVRDVSSVPVSPAMP